MKVALVHDWLTGMRGGERCLESFLALYPEADIFTLIHVPGSTSKKIDERVKATSFLNRLPGVSRYYRALLPLYPAAVRSLKISGYDLVISLSHAAAKNATVPQGTPHICFCFTPMRYIWDLAPTYWGKALPLASPLLSWLKSWDKKGSDGVTAFVAISDFVAKRIFAAYGREAAVIYPAVDISWIPAQDKYTPGEAYLCAGALVPYKRIDLVIRAFNQLQRPLWVAGSGPEEQKLRKIAAKTITFCGRVSDNELAGYYRNCRALLFPGIEDFGMIPVECMAAGRPVIGIKAGGLIETCASPETALFFPPANDEQIIQGIIRAVNDFEKRESSFDPRSLRKQAEKFSQANFFGSWKRFVQQFLVMDTDNAQRTATAF
jgi:glycosyltransferase involved in cell wall biosynthesis